MFGGTLTKRQKAPSNEATAAYPLYMLFPEIIKAAYGGALHLEAFLHRSLVAGARAVVGIAPDRV
jgi:hypothetical protein